MQIPLNGVEPLYTWPQGVEVLPWPWQPVSHQALGLLLFSCVAKGVSVYFNLCSLMSEV